MKAIVHIGTEKTGTTSIQRYLYLNRKKLKGAGFHFIQSAGVTNNRAIPAYCMSNDRYDDFFRVEGIVTLEQREDFRRKFLKKFEHEIKTVPRNIHTFIMSSEHLHSRIRSEAEMEKVHALLSPYFDEIKIVCYLREQVTTCTSYYSTHLKSGGTDSFAAFLQRCKPTNYYFNYYEMLASWERFFGLQALDVSLFAQNCFLNGDLLDDFTAKIDPALVGTLSKSIQIENESLRPVGQALARAVNIIFPIKTLRPEAIGLRDRATEYINRTLKGKGQQSGLDARKMISDSFIECNEQLRQKFFPNVDILFPVPVEVVEFDNGVPENDFEVIADVIALLRKHGKGVMSPEEYALASNAILSCINDVSRKVNDSKDVGIEVVINEKDAMLLTRAARRFERRENDSALRLITLASLARPNWLNVKMKMEEYLQCEGQGPRPQFMFSYYRGEKPLDLDDSETFARFREWLISLNVSVGNLLTGLNGTTAVDAQGVVSMDHVATPQGYSIVDADSLNAAIAIAKTCPFLDLGGFIRVSELEYDVA